MTLIVLPNPSTPSAKMCTHPLQSTAVFIFVQIMVLPKKQEVPEVLQNFHIFAAGGHPSVTVTGPAAGGPVPHEALKVAWQLVLLVGEHEEYQCCVEATHILLHSG